MQGYQEYVQGTIPVPPAGKASGPRTRFRAMPDSAVVLDVTYAPSDPEETAQRRHRDVGKLTLFIQCVS
jgi:hypothetical protein